MSDKSEIVVRSFGTNELLFPEPSETVDPTTAKRTRSCIAKYSVTTDDGKTLVNEKALGHILHTDTIGVRGFVSDLDDEDKFSSGREHYVRTPAVRKEIDERIEKPYDTKKRENLRDSAKCLEIVRDNQESERVRNVREVNNREGQRHLKARKIKRDGITNCEHSGELLSDNAHAHHRVRRADDPDKALDLDNIEIVNPEHHDEHHRKEMESANLFSGNI
ncbi:hypothetical protein M3916_002985 [Vibrio parahaemolyticus]|nr:hypothetical protein [Vibrio parahaemolyticus]HCE4591739.1 hypothetical protein [Vibrio parahaemolyticus]HCG5926445.1 hypothetical protein [Vibrio parahaemolyticus]HCG6120769.1 hypothetical protein [Vibrio parahaemolyticus]